MRNPAILLFLSMFLPMLCFGQRDYCKKIKKSEENALVTYKSPVLKNTSVIKQLKEPMVFSLHIHFKDIKEHFETHGAEVEFEDGTILKDENIKVHCVQELSSVSFGGATAENPGEYLLQGFFSITDENLAKFTTRRIVRVQLHTAIRPVPVKDAIAIMNYVICMYDLK